MLIVAEIETVGENNLAKFLLVAKVQCQVRGQNCEADVFQYFLVVCSTQSFKDVVVGLLHQKNMNLHYYNGLPFQSKFGFHFSQFGPLAYGLIHSENLKRM